MKTLRVPLRSLPVSPSHCEVVPGLRRAPTRRRNWPRLLKAFNDKSWVPNDVEMVK